MKTIATAMRELAEEEARTEATRALLETLASLPARVDSLEKAVRELEWKVTALEGD